MAYVARRELYASKGVSDVTSETYWVGDAAEITLQFPTASSNTVQVTNADGRSAAIVEADWSTITTASTGIINIEPGMRWLRCLSNKTDMVLNLQNRS